MLEEHPHKLQLQVITPEENDEYNRPIPETGGEYWQDVTDCFCHDNSQQKEVSVNGERWVYNYHVVYEGKKDYFRISYQMSGHRREYCRRGRCEEECRMLFGGI